MDTRTRNILTVVAFAAIILVGTYAALASPSVRIPSARTAVVESEAGLQLIATVGETTVSGREGVVVTVEEYNPTLQAVKVTRGQNWPSSDLRMSTCYSSVYPFGIALFQGRYDSSNVVLAKPLTIYPFAACPLLLRYISGYYFEPHSNRATVLPGVAGNPLPMMSNKTITGTYTFGGAQPIPLAPGTYTVEIGDEWGAVSFLYFGIG
jgi:hypothetical protein